MAKSNALSALDGLKKAKGIEKVNDLETKKFATEGNSEESQSMANSEDIEEQDEDTLEDKASRTSSTINRLKAKKKASMYHTTSVNFEGEIYAKLNKLAKTTGLSRSAIVNELLRDILQ